MAQYLAFGRREYAEPLQLIGEITMADEPTLATAGVGADWLELVVFPRDDAHWVVRDGYLASGREVRP